MKCEKKEEFVFNTLKDYKYLLLKENVFSLKDMAGIADKSFLYELYNFVEKFENHILSECTDCKYEGQQCMGCLSKDFLMAYNHEVVFQCKHCHLIYHKKCSNVHPCKIDLNYKFD